MKSMIDVLGSIDEVLKPAIDEILNPPAAQEWPRYQHLKELFNNLVKPIEQMVAHLYPLPPYQTMR